MFVFFWIYKEEYKGNAMVFQQNANQNTNKMSGNLENLLGKYKCLANKVSRILGVLLVEYKCPAHKSYDFPKNK